MPSLRVSTRFNKEMHFVTLTIKDWRYVLDRHGRWDILIKSLRYCQEFKELKIYAYVLMINHIHLIVQNPNVAGFLCDFKKHTAFELMKNMRVTEPYLAKLFEISNGHYQVWEKTNVPKMIETESFFQQKKNYIEENPVDKCYVADPRHWIYSSAFEPNLLKVERFD
jgi:putative transposase